MNTCAICNKSCDLFTLTIPGDEDNGGEDFNRFVCGVCWETIVNLTRRVTEYQFAAMQKELDELRDRIGEIEDHEVSPYEAIMIVEQANRR